MTSKDTMKEVLTTTFLVLIFGLDVMHCYSKAPERKEG